MFNFASTSLWRRSARMLLLVACLLGLLINCTSAVKIRNGADPTIMKVGDFYYSAESAGGIWVRKAAKIEELNAEGKHERKQVWTDDNNRGDVWAPEITTENGRTYIYFTAGVGKDHRMFVISAASPLAQYSRETQLNLPDNQWAIDGTYFVFEGQRYFVWSGWASESNNNEQNLYICRMNSPTQATGQRYIISQPREPWERAQGNPYINESPEAIKDPNGQLHIVYSANGSWGSRYCLGDLRLRKGGDPTYVWDWYKSNGCLFGSHQENMMQGWDATLHIDGPGHHTFALGNGDIANSIGGGDRIPFVYHGVEKGIPYDWSARAWYTGTFVWWGSTTYRRANVPGDNTNTGASFKFFE